LKKKIRSAKLNARESRASERERNRQRRGKIERKECES